MSKFLNIRGVDDEVARTFAAGASVRGWTQAEYLRALLELHSFARLTYDPEKWEWDGDGDGDSLDETRFYITGTNAEEFVNQLGRYMFTSRLLGITA